MDPERLERTLAEDITTAVSEEGADVAVAAPARPLGKQNITLGQHALEQGGIPTVSPTVARDVTEHTKPPRAVFLPSVMGHHSGVPFHRELQRRIILDGVDHPFYARESGEIRTLPILRAESRREGSEIERRLGRRA